MKRLREHEAVDVVIYHYPCNDGLAAFWVFQKVYPNALGIPKAIDKVPLEKSIYEGKHVVMVDIVTCDYKEIAEAAASFVVLDHHKTSQEALAGLSYARFDMKRSGVGLAWETAFIESEMPDFLKYIEERDLFTFSGDISKHFNAGLNAHFEANKCGIESKLDCFSELALQRGGNAFMLELIRYGECVIKLTQSHVESLLKSSLVYAVLTPLPSHECCRAIVTECPHHLISDFGNYAITHTKDIDLVIGWRYDHKSEQFWYSVRSDDKHADASAFCKAFGGGGHRNACGFSSAAHPRDLFMYTQIGACCTD